MEQTRHIVEKKCPPTKTWSKPKHFLLTNLDTFPTLELPLITILGLSEHDSHHQIHSLFPSFDLGKSKENPKHPRDFHIQILINEHWAYNHTTLNKRIKKYIYIKQEKFDDRHNTIVTFLLWLKRYRMIFNLNLWRIFCMAWYHHRPIFTKPRFSIMSYITLWWE